METHTEQVLPQKGWSQQRQGGGSRALDARRFRGQGKPPRNGVEGRARALGWFSVGLGIARLLAPGGLSRFTIGRDGWRHRRTMRLLGARELACGIGILARRRSGWLWMRVAGDLMDLAMLASALPARRAQKARLLRSMAGVVGVTALDLVTGIQVARQGRGLAADEQIFTRAITVNRPPEEVYRFWRNLENLPRFMVHLESVQVRDERRSHWVARGPAGKRVEWDAEITVDHPGELLSWCSAKGSQIQNAGTVRFQRAPGGRGTEIVLELEYVPPVGIFPLKLARLLGEEPSQKAASDLRRFKQVIETGEVLHSDASIHRGPHPARPPEARELSRQGGRR